jgi:hypothetical protein
MEQHSNYSELLPYPVLLEYGYLNRKSVTPAPLIYPEGEICASETTEAVVAGRRRPRQAFLVHEVV